MSKHSREGAEGWAWDGEGKEGESGDGGNGLVL